MAKRMLAEEERAFLTAIVHEYNDVLNDEAIEKNIRKEMRIELSAWVGLVRFALYLDRTKVIGRALGVMRNGLRQVGKKRQKKLREYNKLVGKLRTMCGNKSELSGGKPTWEFGYKVEPHHIMGRTGEMLTDPFNIIMLTSSEHTEQDGNTNDEKMKLLAFIKPIRLKQGFK